MSRDQVLRDDKIHLDHKVSGGGHIIDFVFSSTAKGEITLTFIYKDSYEKTHIEYNHKMMNCFTPYLVEWLKEKISLREVD